MHNPSAPNSREISKLERKGYFIVHDSKEANLFYKRIGYSAPDGETGEMYASQRITIRGEINNKKIEHSVSWLNRDRLVDVPVLILKNTRLINKLKSCEQLIRGQK